MKVKQKATFLYIIKAAKLGGARGARAPWLFLPRPEIIHISVYLFFCPAPKLYLYLHPHYLVHFGASEHKYILGN